MLLEAVVKSAQEFPRGSHMTPITMLRVHSPFRIYAIRHSFTRDCSLNHGHRVTNVRLRNK